MHFQSFTALVALASSAQALSTPNHYVSHEKRGVTPKNWIHRGDVKSDTILPMRIGLRQPNIENGRGEELMNEVSHPDSPHYGKWYTPEQIIELFAPPQNSVDSVRTWLEEAGIAAERISHSTNKQWIQFDAKIHEAEALLKTKFSEYEHAATGNVHVACDEYHLPRHLSENVVDFVTPGIKLLEGAKASGPPELVRRDSKVEKRGVGVIPIIGPVISTLLAKLLGASPLAHCDQYITPECIMAMYNVTRGDKSTKGNELGVFEYGDFYSAEDLVAFFAVFAPYIPVTTRPILKGVDGGFAPGAVAGGESNLDFQIAYPLIYPQQSVLFQSDDLPYSQGIQPSGGLFNTFFDAIDGSYCTYSAYGETGNSDIDPVYPDPNPAGYQGQLQCGVYKPTNVISISYGAGENFVPTNYQQRQCNEVMKLGMQGVSIVIASGDSGVAARLPQENNGCLGNGEVFQPDFLASCPYITAVGGTTLPTGGDASKDQEIAVTRFPSGGGFSNIHKQPSYQSSAVNTYLTDHTPSYPSYSTSGTNNPPESVTQGGRYNRDGRGYPDVSAVGDNVIIFNNGVPTLIGGTSASAPVFASLINRINEERIAKGKGPVGFLNPTLYAHPEMFHDITVGNNSGCGTPGFYAAKGWDPVTGLGTPNYPAMLNVFMALP